MPASFALVAYGGAGPLHAVEVAREIGIRRVIIPHAPGVFSAFGMLFSDLRYDFVRTWLIAARGRAVRGHRGASIASSRIEGRAADRRHIRQAAKDHDPARRRHALCRPGACRDGRHPARGVRSGATAPQSSAQFDAMHELRYGTCAPDERAEIVSLRSTVTGIMRKPPHAKIARGRAAPPRRRLHGPAHGLFRRARLRRHADLSARRISAPATASRARR